MARPETSPWMVRALQMLQDSPQPFEVLVADAGALIPPGRAWRERELSRKYVRVGHQPPPQESEITDEAIWVGRRNLMRKYLWVWVRDGRIITYKENGGQRIFALRQSDARE